MPISLLCNMQRGPGIALFMLDFVFISGVLEMQIFIAQEKTANSQRGRDTEQVTLEQTGK